jgi:hypothetical protein
MAESITSIKKAAPVTAANQQQVAQAKSANAKAQSAEGDEDFEDEGPSFWQEMLRDSPSWLTSLIVHMVILLVLALWMLPAQVKEVLGVLSVNPNDAVEEELEEIVPEVVEELDVNIDQVTEFEVQPETDNIEEIPDFSVANDLDAAPVAIDLDPLGEMTAPKNNLLNEIGSVTGKGVSGRGQAARSGLVKAGGGNAASEQAVALALKWLAAHQLPDGGWDLDHRKGPGVRSQKDPGNKNSRNGATALALLPFLGAGQTHKEGSYKKVIDAGLRYLVRNIKLKGQVGALNDGGNMYAHGLGAIALCEAYAMTKDGGLAAPAQSTLNFIVTAQDPVGGGWRYTPRQPGDTSAVGWQIMALKSGHLAYLNVPHITIEKASKFLDSVQVDSGSGYGYADPGNGHATSAVGLLCRMYLGWKKDNGPLQRGVENIAKWGPSKTDAYFNYYAMQVMFQASNGGQEGPHWKKWNAELRDYLVGSQGKQGTETGRWFFKGGHANEAGGRLYCTSMACMTLEVYYRHMPIYAKAAVEEDFPD